MQKETHENILLDLKANHQEKYDLLEKEKDEAQVNVLTFSVYLTYLLLSSVYAGK